MKGVARMQKVGTGLDLQKEGWKTFCEQLAELLRRTPGKWIAFHGREQAALADSKQGVYKRLLAQGYNLHEVVVHRIEPLPPPIDVRFRAGR
jgi:hypothetical protein